MKFGILDRPLSEEPLDTRPLTFIDPDAQQTLAQIMAIQFCEDAPAPERERWQRSQFTHVLGHAYQKSAFWRNRITSARDASGFVLPVLTREEVRHQVRSEGALVDGAVAGPPSTGSTGVPVSVFVTPAARAYSSTRILAQLFHHGTDFTQNRVLLNFKHALDRRRGGANLSVQQADSWLGPLSKLFRSGTNRNVEFADMDEAVVSELLSQPVGYITCLSRVMEQLLSMGGPDLLRRMGVKVWTHRSDLRSQDAVEALKSVGIRTRSNYSAKEVGFIGFECDEHPGYYHVAHSNVVVEADETVTVTVNGERLGRLLVTHLHSYATPIIRYDIGDFGRVEPSCPCGREGPTLSRIYGRGKHTLRHPDGRHIAMPTFNALIAPIACDEIKMTQTKLDTIIIELGGISALSPDKEAELRRLAEDLTDPAFTIVIRAVDKIDWSDNPKRLGFVSRVE